MSDLTCTDNPLRTRDDYLGEIKELRQGHSDMKGTEVQQKMLCALEAVEQEVKSQATSLNLAEMESAREQVPSIYYIAREKMLDFSENYATSNADAAGTLESYADFYRQLVAGCRVENPEDESEKFDKAVEDCDSFYGKDETLLGIVVSGFPNPGESRTRNELFAALNYSPKNTLQRFAEFTDLEEYYSQISGRIGYHRDLGPDKRPYWLVGMGPLAEFEFVFVRGEEENLASRVNQFGLQTGWKQPLLGYRFKKSRFGVNAFVSPKVGLGYAQTWLDFGRGFPLEKEQSLMGLTEVSGGIEFDRGRLLALFIGGGYFYDRSLSTSDHLESFYNQGVIFEVGGSGDLPVDFLSRLFK